jgi:LysM repeat protein
MKRAFFVWVALALCSAPVVRAQDAATQQRFDELSGRIENLAASQETLAKQLTELKRELASVREMASKPTGNWATPEDLKRVAKGIEEVDRKRSADYELVQKQLKEIRQAVDRPLPQPKKITSSPTRETQPPEKTSTPREGVEHVIKSGETLSSIVQGCKEQKIKVTQKQILEANPGLKADLLIPGKKIFIPAVPQP